MIAFPGPGWDFASPQTAITFSAGDPGAVQVVGSDSGPHTGRLHGLRGRPGAVFTPDRAFEPGERVTVTAGTRVVGAGGRTFSFGVSRPAYAPHPTPDFSGLPGLTPGPRRAAGLGTCRLHRPRLRTLPRLRPAGFCVNRRTTRRGGRRHILVAPRSHPERQARDQHGVMLFSAAGRLQWYSRRPAVARDFKVVRYRGRRLLAFHEDPPGDDDRYVLLNHRYRPVLRLRARYGYPTNLHELQITRRGTAYLSSYVPVFMPRSLRIVTDYVIQEIDIATRDVLFEWHSLDHVPPSATYQPRPAPGYSWDYFHGNSIEPPDRRGTLIVSGRNTSAIYGIARRTGRLRWTFGGRRDQFGLVRRHPERQFCAQHDARHAAGGTITLFDNGGPVLGTCPIHRARVQQFRLHIRARRAQLVRTVPSYASSPDGRGLYAWAMGSVRGERGGTRLINWGTTGYVTEVAPDGRVVFGLRLQYYTYRAIPARWRGFPTGRPAIAVRRAGPAVRVWASWNGATEIRSWQVLAGRTPDALRPLGRRRFRGLETAMRVRTRRPYVAVRALDRRGAGLGRSAAVHVRAAPTGAGAPARRRARGAG
ncbi:MAG TPA: arylsulfotransferase family protein [Solirubrobacteraceae bacterium]|nr:arylsulfotransferase family protein [Solirubrobacteraceae bacterium]